ncbi:uncharacterized protein LOC115674516 [Syzygium oleosum]|uniref:uncharacterized protein LOC115674516 n=1 Tax=Syzygium oleosum TaxID=219896 RepID=UPI0011D2B178|nr:uncharacterized protein LOC115674516 [Syzygium oleosum]
MGVAVLHPQSHRFVADPLFPRKHGRGLSQPAARPPPGAKTKPSSNRAHHNRRRRSPTKSVAASSPPTPAPPAKGLAMGRVRILKRGEEIASPPPPPPALESKVETEAARTEEGAGGASPARELAQARTQKAEPCRVSAGGGPDRVLAGFYAGSAFITSPPPSSVPMPAFLQRRPVVWRDLSTRRVI